MMTQRPARIRAILGLAIRHISCIILSIQAGSPRPFRSIERRKSFACCHGLVLVVYLPEEEREKHNRKTAGHDGGPSRETTRERRRPPLRRPQISTASFGVPQSVRPIPAIARHRTAPAIPAPGVVSAGLLSGPASRPARLPIRSGAKPPRGPHIKESKTACGF